MIIAQESNLIEKEIYVKPYLTYAQIQNIVDKVCVLDLWSQRQQTIDILLLHYATDLTDDEIEEFGHNELLQSGIIDEVKANIKNLHQVYEAIDYTESTRRSLNKIVQELPKIMEPLKKVMDNGNKSSKK